MSKFILSKAMGNIPDDMLREAMEVKKHTGRKWILRAAACAAVLALLIGAMLFGNGSGKNPPFVSVIVYAADGHGVELKLPDENSAVSNVTDEDDLSYSSGPLPEPDKIRFRFSILLNEYEKKYSSYKVYQDGNELIRLNTKELSVGTAFSFEANQENGKDQYTVSTQTIVTGRTEKKTEIEIHYLKENGDLLLKCVISITPQAEDFLIVLEKVHLPEE